MEPKDVLTALGQSVRLARQREGWTQQDLSRRSGIPATTISRLECTGLVASDSLFRVLFALDQLDAVQDFLKERIRLVSFPKTLAAAERRTDVKRIRHKGGRA